VQATKGGNVVASTTTDNEGRFTLALEAGDYTISALGRGTEPQDVHVTASTLTEVAFLIDTGIR
jgi:hypothetical protein